eukprot:scaffold15275_cov171-Skeletonema_dohrnii-CCMP3373.AAC.1
MAEEAMLAQRLVDAKWAEQAVEGGLHTKIAWSYEIRSELVSNPNNRSFVDLERKVYYDKGCGSDHSVIHGAEMQV